MLNEQHARRITVFFLLATLDESAAFQASHKIIAAMKSRAPGDLQDDSKLNVRMMQMCTKQLAAVRKQTTRNKSALTFQDWGLPDNFDLGPWSRYQKQATEDELLTLIFSKIWKCSEQEVAAGLRVSSGTVRYRLGRAIKTLGMMNQARA